MRGGPFKSLGLLANAARAKTIVGVLVRHGFADLIEQIDPSGHWWRHFVPSPAEKRSTFEHLRLAAEELGPTFVKFGQLLSMRPDVIPHGLILELRKLQDSVQPLPFAEMRPVLVEALGRDPAEVFAEFDETPTASASLAQVYFARLRAGGRPVAVKVQRPNLAKIVAADLDLIAWFAGQIHQRVAALRPFDLPAVVVEARAGFLQELDFRHEARNQRFFNSQNPAPEKVFAPEVIDGLASRCVLVMERIDGRRVEAAGLPPAQAQALAAAGAVSLLHQIIIEGFFHADPHSGNVLVTPDGRLCLLDWGLAGHLTRRLRHALADLFVAAAAHDAEEVVRIAASLTDSGRKPDLRRMEKEVTIALRENLNYSIGREELGRLILRLLHIFGSNGISVSRDYALMAKAVVSIEEVGRALDPAFDLRDVARPVLRELHRERWGAAALFKQTRALLSFGLLRLQDLPGELERILRRLEQDDLTINLQHRGLDALNEALNRSSNRLTLGVIIGSLIIGSSLIITTGFRPYLFGYPALGIVGYVLSALLGLWVVWDIFRHGRHR